MMPCRLRFSLAAVALVISALPAAGQAPVDRAHTEKRLAPFPPEVYDSAVLSPDGRRLAYVRQMGQRQAAVIDGTQEDLHERVNAINFSPNSQWWAYAAESAGQWFIVINGRPLPPQRRVGPPVFSPHSKRLAYTALQSDGEHVAVMEANHPPGNPYERIFEGKLIFSPDSARLAYGARREGRWYLVLDGDEIGPYDFLGAETGIQFSGDSQRVAFAALQGTKWCVVVAGRAPRRSGQDAGAPSKADDHASRKADDHDAGQCYDNVGSLVFSSDGEHIAYAAQAAGKWRLVLDGKAQPPTSAIGEGTLQFSPDGATLAYAAQSNSKWLVVSGGREGKPYDSVGPLRFSPHGRLLAYAARLDSAEMVVVNSRPQKVFDRVDGHTLVFSPDSARLGYVAQVGRARFAVIDGKRNPRYDAVSNLTFTPDGSHYVYAATQNGTALTVVDQQPSAHRYDAIWNVPEARFLFDSRKRFHYLAVRSGDIFLVEEEVE